MNSVRDSVITRCAGVLVASTSALVALWSATIPSPEWPLNGDPSPLDPVALDPVALDPTVLFSHGARIVASLMLGYLAVAAGLNLIVGLFATRVRLPSRLTRAAARAPGWLRAASTGLVAGSALLAPTVAAAAPLPDEPGAGAVTMEVVVPGAGSSSDRAHRAVLPWALPHTTPSPAASPTTASADEEPADEAPAGPEPAGAEPAAPRTTPTSTAEPEPAPRDSAPTTSTILEPAPLPDPPRLEPIPADEPPQLIPPLVLERSPDGQVNAAPPAIDDSAVTQDQHTVAPGEHFWAIAERVVADRQLHVPVADYWRLLVEANRSQLTDPSNPSLLFPGQVLVVP